MKIQHVTATLHRSKTRFLCRIGERFIRRASHSMRRKTGYGTPVMPHAA
jgi:hypothetical protein